MPEFLGGTSKDEGFDVLERNIGVWNPTGKDPYFLSYNFFSLFPGEPKEEKEEVLVEKPKLVEIN